jgi:hypothetical protein
MDVVVTAPYVAVQEDTDFAVPAVYHIEKLLHPFCFPAKLQALA